MGTRERIFKVEKKKSVELSSSDCFSEKKNNKKKAVKDKGHTSLPQ